MKNLYSFLVAVICLSVAYTSNAQTSNKPKLFSAFPDNFECNEADLASVFSSTLGQTINVNFQQGFNFNGLTTNNIVRYSNLQSVTIKSPTFSNAVLSISKATNADGSVEYTGTIVNPDYFDGYKIAKNKMGVYTLTKFETDKVLFTCQH